MSLASRLAAAERRAGLAGGDCPACRSVGGMMPLAWISSEADREAALAARKPCPVCGALPRLLFVWRPAREEVTG